MPVRNAHMAEIFLQAFESLKKKDKDAFFERLLDVKEYKEDLIDLAILEARKKEPRRPLRDYLAERKKKVS